MKVSKKINEWILLKKLRQFDHKYYAVVYPDWEQKKFSSTVWFYKKTKDFQEDSTTVSFTKGLQLGIDNDYDNKELIFLFDDPRAVDLIKKYANSSGINDIIIMQG